MGRIYTLALRSVIYLGEEDRTSAGVFTNIKSIVQEIREETDEFVRFQDVVGPASKGTTASTPMRTRLNVPALIWFFSRPWFSRVWVIQEAALATSNLCVWGTRSIDFKLVLMTAVWLNSYHFFHIPIDLATTVGLDNAAQMWRYLHDTNSFHLNEMLVNGWRLDATDPRDKVFGILGLTLGSNAPGPVPELLKPDYSKSVQNIYRDATRYALQLEDGFKVLSVVHHRQDDDLGMEGFSTWVPRFDSPFELNKDPAFLLRTYWDGVTPSALNLELSADQSDPDVIVLSGIIFDEIEYCSSVYSDVYSEDASMSERWLLATMELTDTQGIARERLARALMADMTYDWQRCSTEDLKNVEPYLKHPQAGRDLPHLSDLTESTDKYTKSAVQFEQAMLHACYNRRLVLTKQGFLCVVPRISRPTDIIVLVYADMTPLVLRPVGEEYQMVGQCYTEGLMDYGSIERLKEDGRPDTVLKIH